MTNNFEKMMETFMEKYMENMMAKMFSNMLETTSNAEVETATATKKATPKTLSKEDFLALTEETEEVTPMELDFVVFGNKTARYNRSVPSDIWIVNHLAITSKYGAKWSKKNNGYIFETSYELRNFLTSYQIKNTLTDADKKAVSEYKKETAQKRAEYYANLAK